MTQEIENTSTQEDTITDDNQVDDSTVVDDKQNGDSVIDDVKDDDVKDVKDVELDEKDVEIGQLRQMVRDQRRDFRELESKVISDKSDVAVKPDDDDYSDDDESKEVDVKQTLDIQNQQIRSTQLETYVENMRISDKYSDVDQVVSQPHLDDMIETWANIWLKENPNEGLTLNDAIAGIERDIWSKPNPYRLMYDAIKKNHPSYVKTKGDVKIPVKDDDIAPSVNNLPGAKKTEITGWTAAKIDAMAETELGKVPKDVYELYLQEKLK